MTPLSDKEIAFLLQGQAAAEDIHSHSLKLLEALAGLSPKRRMGMAVFLLCVSILPLLGGTLFRQAYGEAVYWTVFVTTALAGSYLIWKYANRGLQEVVHSIRREESPAPRTVHLLVRAFAGLLLLMPGPVINILACVLLLPPCSRLAAIAFSRRLGRYLDEPY